MRIFRPAVVAALSLVVAAQAFAAYRISAWIPPWDGNALTSIQMNGGAINEANPVWYSWNADGTIAKNWNAENQTWRAAMTGAQIIPSIQNVVNKSFSATAVETMLSTPASREAHAAAIAQLVINSGLDGIDVDYERIPATSKANFSAFVSTLSGKLHTLGKRLSVTVYAKTSDVSWNGAGGEDWGAIAGAADSVKIMAYDYHYSGSDPGPIAPLDWLDKVVTYAEGVIPASKIMVGLPWYGYDWTSVGAGANATYTSATLVAQNNGVAVQHDVNGEATYSYNGHVVYFEDATSYAKKIDLLKSKHGGIAGVANWAAGVEDPAIWNVIRGTATPAPTPAPAQPLPTDFTITGANLLTVVQGSNVTADYRLTAINGFTGTASMTVLAPAGLNGVVSASTPSISAASPLTLHVAATTATAPGAYQVTLHFTSGTVVHDNVLTIVVDAMTRRRAATR